MGRPLTEFLRSLEACDRDKVTAPIPSRADASHNSGCRARYSFDRNAQIEATGAATLLKLSYYGSIVSQCPGEIPLSNSP
jgi:hypothetical protein